jgi:predicted MPP superfamily phosphohydrolase
VQLLLYYATFAVPALAAFYFMHHYAWARLVRDPGFPPAWKRGLTAAFLVLGTLFLGVFFFSRQMPSGRTSATIPYGFLWLGVLFYLMVLLAVFDLARFIARRVRRGNEPEDPARRVFLARVAAGVAAAGTAGIVIGGRRAAFEITKPELAVALPRLPPALSGFRIAHLTDLHLGPMLQSRFLETVVEETNACRPDLVVITGDLVDGSVERLGPALASFAKLRARCGVAFVTGNHEYYSGAEEWVAFLRARGIAVLLNERVSIGDSAPGGASFDLAGVTDHHGGRFLADHAPDLERALRGRDPERALVYLAHQPKQIELARGLGVGLQLSGHTHGGQMWPFGALVALTQPFVAGRHETEDGTTVYVSRGTGFWGPPMRVLEPAEIATIILTA